MKHLKLFGLTVIAVVSLMSFAAPASAAWLTSPTGTTYTSLFTATSHSPIELDGTFVTVKCSHAHLEGHVVGHSPEFGKPVVINLTTHSFTGCNYSVTVAKAGTLLIHAIGPPTGSEVEHTGTVTSTGTEMSVHTSVGTCVFTTSSTDIGTLTGTDDTKGHATIDVNAEKLPRTGGSFLCGSSGTLTGGYTITTPSTLWVDELTG